MKHVSYRRLKRRMLSLRLLSAAAISLHAAHTFALPTGGKIVGGQGAINQKGNGTTITQGSSNLAINWNTFGIARNEFVNFVQPSSTSVALNRVIGNEASGIFGQLSANGQIFLVNPGGILFAPGAQVDLGGLVASTLNIRTDDFMAGRYNFYRDGASGSVVNQGSITAAEGGFAALLGPQVRNGGIIVARKGTVALAAGDAATLDFGDGLLRVTVDKPTQDALAQNSGLIQADGGAVIMTASAKDAVLASVVNNEGIIEARSISQQNGSIILDGGDSGITANSGTLNVSGRGTGESGGIVKVLGSEVRLTETAKVDASGDVGGGTVLIGGDFHGSGPERNASSTTVEKGAVIEANAISNGDGGRVALWSDGTTALHGSISATGGAVSGNGGFVETSGGRVSLRDAVVKAGAQGGKPGIWLIDPTNIVIGHDSGDISDADISTFFNGGSNLILTVTASGPGALLTVNGASDPNGPAAIVKTTPGSCRLELNSAGDIAIHSGATIGAADPSSTFNLDLRAGLGGIPGSIDMGSASVNTNGGVFHALSNGNIKLGNINAGAGIVQMDTHADDIAAGGMITQTVGTAIDSQYLSTNSLGGQTLTGANTISVLSAMNSGSGDIVVNNTGNLTLDGAAISNPAGSVALTDAGSIYLVGGIGITPGIYAAGNVRLTATGANSDITFRNGLYPSVWTENGDVTLVAGRDITLGDLGFWGDISNAGPGSIFLTAGRNLTIFSSSIRDNWGTMDFAAAGDISLVGGTDLMGLGLVSLTSTGGSILVDPAVLISTAYKASLSAAAGSITQTMGSGRINGPALSIVSSGPALFAANNTVDTIAANVTGPGSSFEFGTVFNVTTGSVNGMDGITTNSGNVKLSSMWGNITLAKDVSAGTASVNVVTGGGAVTETTGKVRAGALQISAVNASVLDNANDVATVVADVTGAGEGFRFTDANTLAVGAAAGTGITTNNGSVNVQTTSGSLTVHEVAAGDAPVTLTAGGDLTTVGAVTTAGSGAISLSAAGTLTVGGALTAAGNGDVTISAAGGTGDIVVGSGVTSGSGAITANAGRDVIINTGNLDTAGNVTVNAIRRFTNNAGPTAIQAGRWLVYSADPAGDLKGGLAADFKRYNCTYAGGCLTPDTTIPATGNGFLYAIAPILKVSGSPITSIYGDVPDLSSISTNFGGFIDGDTAATAQITGSAVFSSTGSGTSNAGSYNLSADVSGLRSALGYRFQNDGTGNGGKHTINPATLTVTAHDTTKVYGDSDPTLSYQVTGFKVTDSEETVMSGVLNRDPGENVGSYGITQGSVRANGNNYTIAYVGSDLKITPAELTITADGKSKAYGDADPTLTFHATGWKFHDTESTALTGKLGRASGETVAGGPYAINEGNIAAVNGNYTINFTGNDLAITPAPLTVVADPKGKSYGDPDPALTFQVNGLKFGDSAEAAITGSLSRAPGETVAGGPYSINQGGIAAVNGNYTINFTGNNLTITPAPLTVTADAKSKTYGDPDPALTFSVGGFKFGDTAAGALTGSLSRAPGETAAAGPYAINRGDLATANGNYTISFAGNNLTITPARLAVAADPKSKTYGDADPSFTFTAKGFKFNDSAATTLTGSLSRAPGEDVAAGPYAINQGSVAAANGNYVITFTASNLTITPATLSLNADPKGKSYGDADPALTFTATGFKLNDSAATVLTGGLSRAPGENVAGGPYPINQGSVAANGNYLISFTGSNLTITPAPLSVVADPKSKMLGEPDPLLTYLASGFKFDDSAATVLNGSPGCTAGNSPGSYPITQGTLSCNSNYVMSFTPGVLTVTGAPAVSGTGTLALPNITEVERAMGSTAVYATEVEDLELLTPDQVARVYQPNRNIPKKAVLNLRHVE